MFGNKKLIDQLSKEIRELSMKVSRLEAEAVVDRYTRTIMYEILDESVEWDVIYPHHYSFTSQINTLASEGYRFLKIYEDGTQLWIKKKNAK